MNMFDLGVGMSHETRESKHTGTRREKQKSETRAVILNSAQRLFEEKGFERSTVRMVAADAGVGLGTIFSHFPDKKSLLFATLVGDLDRSNRQAWESMPQDVSVREKMLHLAREGYAAWLRRPALSRSLIREMCFTTGPARDQLRALDRQAIGQVADLLTRAQERGEIRPDVDPVSVARMSFAVYLTTVMSWLDDSDLPAGITEGEDDLDCVSSRLDPIVGETKRFLDYLFEGIRDVRGNSVTMEEEGEK